MMSLLSAETAELGDSFIQQCSSCDAPSARCWCQDCKEPLCDDCVSAHRRVTITRFHRILNQPTAGSDSAPPVKFCRLHPSEPLKLLCLTCRHLTCRDCQLTVHMNHRYHFINEVLNGVKKQLDILVQPIRENRDKVQQSLLDMETRLQHIDQSESNLRSELQRSYQILVQQLKMRMEQLSQQIQTVSESEREAIHVKIKTLKQLQQEQQSVTETAEKAQNTSDLPDLLAYKSQVKSQLQKVQDLSSAPPQTMSQMSVVTEASTLRLLLNFGELKVSWIPFSVSQTSNQSRNPTGPAPAAPSPLTPTCPPLSSRNLLENNFAVDVDPPAPVCGPSASSSSSQWGVNQSVAPVTTPTPAATSAPTVGLLHPSSLESWCRKYKPLKPKASMSLRSSTSSSSLVQIFQPATFLVTSVPKVHQMSCRPQFPLLLGQTAPVSGGRQVLRVASGTAGSSASLKYHSSSQTSSSNQLSLLLSSAAPPSSTCAPPTCRPLPLADNTSDAPVPVSRQSTVDQSEALMTNSGAVSSTHAPSAAETSRHLEVKPKEERLPMEPVQDVSPSAVTSGAQIPVTRSSSSPPGPEHTSALQPVKEEICAVLVSAPPSSAERPVSDAGSPSLDDRRQSPVVLAVADSACSRSDRQVAARTQEPAENEPTSTVSEEAEPAGKPSAPEADADADADADAEEPSSAIGRPDRSRWQPKVSVLKLPVCCPAPGCPLPRFRLVFGEAEDEVYVEEIREDAQSPAEDRSDVCTTPLSSPDSPESPGTLEIVGCSACGGAGASIICSSCARGFHRDCHVPPVGPDVWSEWSCCLCQDAPDPCSSHRPQRPESPCVSALDQEGDDNDALIGLKEKLGSRQKDPLSPELHPPPRSRSKRGGTGSKVEPKEFEPMQTRKRLGDLLDQKRKPGAKRTKMKK